MELCSDLSGDPNNPSLNMFFKPEEEQQQTMDSEPRYTILNEAQIRQRLEDDIARVSAAISEPRASAIVLLRRFNWNLCKLFDRWFDDELSVRSSLGLFANPVAQSPSDRTVTITCGICFEACTDHSSASCGHLFCTACWSSYITESVTRGGAGCLLLTCPHPSCAAAVGEDMVESLASSHSVKERFSQLLLRSYLEDSYLRHRVKWCPSQSCDRAVDFTDSSDHRRRGRSSDVDCRCSHSFCWYCGEEPHSPVGCVAAADWLSRTVDESETAKWMLANTKACPKCRRPIEKSHGCDQMSCPAPCGHGFCWRCLGEQFGHASHACVGPEDEGPAEAETEIEAARASVSKYHHYYERWVGNSKSRRKAVEDLRGLESERLGRLGLNYGLGKDCRWFVVRAWEQMIRCRRVLQWSCAYGYYFPDGEVEKKRFLEYLLGEAESSLERLRECAEDELEPYLEGEAPAVGFDAYRRKLSELTFVIGNYFENLVGALEDGLPEVTLRRWSSPGKEL